MQADGQIFTDTRKDRCGIINAMKYNTSINGFYNFTPKQAYKEIEAHWHDWDVHVKPKTYVIGISGGIDSTCVTALACKIFGKDKVVGVSLPCDGQKDIEDVNKVFAWLGIRRLTIDIGDAFASLKNGIENNGVELTDVCKTNMPARLRMTALYGVAQCLGGVMVNTCNLTEDVVGYSTLYGDNAGSYAPISKLTKTEVIQVAKWLGVPENLANKTPIDGLQPLTDEEKLGITYAKVDDLIRSTGPVSEADKTKVFELYTKNKFKLELVNIPGPKFNRYPNYPRTFWS